MITNILTKAVTLTVKELLIGLGIVTACTTVVTGGLMFEHNRKKIANVKRKEASKWEDKVDGLNKQIDQLDLRVFHLRKELVKSAKDEYANKVEGPNEIYSKLASSKLDDERKLLISEYYKNLYKRLESNISEIWEKDNRDTIEKIATELNIIRKYVYDNNIGALSLFADQAKAENEKREIIETYNRERAKEREQREHEMALKKEENKKLDKYYEHIEDMKKMDIEAQKMKTAAFAGVAKSAIDTLNKEKDE